MNGRITRGIVAVALVAGGVGGQLASSSPASAVVVKTVAVKDDLFKPRAITVARGTRIKWVNRGERVHTTTSTKGLWNVTLSPGETYARTFRKAGTFRYVCSLHSDMTGKIVVT